MTDKPVTNRDEAQALASASTNRKPGLDYVAAHGGNDLLPAVVGGGTSLAGTSAAVLTGLAGPITASEVPSYIVGGALGGVRGMLLSKAATNRGMMSATTTISAGALLPVASTGLGFAVGMLGGHLASLQVADGVGADTYDHIRAENEAGHTVDCHDAAVHGAEFGADVGSKLGAIYGALGGGLSGAGAGTLLTLNAAGAIVGGLGGGITGATAGYSMGHAEGMRNGYNAALAVCEAMPQDSVTPHPETPAKLEQSASIKK